MTLIVRPALAIILGLALTLYGIFHAITRYPGSEAFTELAAGLPTLQVIDEVYRRSGPLRSST